MTRDDILRMAEEAGLRVPYWGEGEDPAIDPPHWAMPSPLPPLLERFAALVAAEEAKVTSEQEPLARFYGVTSKDELIAALERHILRVQARNSHHE